MKLLYLSLGLSLLGAGLTATGGIMRHYEQHHSDDAPAAEQAGPIYTYEGTVERIIDGDTISVSISSFPAPFNPISVRVDHVNTPETRPRPRIARLKTGGWPRRSRRGACPLALR